MTSKKTNINIDDESKKDEAKKDEAKKDDKDVTSNEEELNESGSDEKDEVSDSEEKDNASEEAEEDENSKYMRLAADFQNYKRRTEQEKSDIYKYANEKFATELLEVLDNFERAIDQELQGGADETIDEKFIEGMKMIFAQMLNVLKQNGIEEIEAIGTAFDPNMHHAVMTEKTEEYESGEVTKVMQKGYTLKGKVIRPSMVAVAE